jgi:hypothetical protein
MESSTPVRASASVWMHQESPDPAPVGSPFTASCGRLSHGSAAVDNAAKLRPDPCTSPDAGRQTAATDRGLLHTRYEGRWAGSWRQPVSQAASPGLAARAPWDRWLGAHHVSNAGLAELVGGADSVLDHGWSWGRPAPRDPQGKPCFERRPTKPGTVSRRQPPRPMPSCICGTPPAAIGKSEDASHGRTGCLGRLVGEDDRRRAATVRSPIPDTTLDPGR